MKNRATKRPSNKNIKELGKLIKDIRVAMLTSVDEKGRMHSRPMATLHTEFDGSLWFFTSKESRMATELKKLEQVQISYSEPKDQRYLSVTGIAELVNDSEMAQRLWNPFYKAWFPKGLGDPNLVLLKVDVKMVEYWESLSSPVVRLFGFAKAVISGKPYEDEGSIHRKVNLAS